MSVLLLGVSFVSLSPETVQLIRSRVKRHEVVMTEDPEEMARIAPEVEILVGDVGLDRVLSSPKLRWIQLWSTGADHVLLDFPEMVHRDVQVTNTRGVQAIPITEHVFALILTWTRQLNQFLSAQGERTWLDPYALPMTTMAGKTMVILGAGTVGRQVARMAKSFGMRTLGIRHQGARPIPYMDQMYELACLTDALQQADYVVVTLPLTPETRGLIGLRELRAIPTTALLVNVGRGAVIDEGALSMALRARWIAGAALDVVATEPLPATSPLWTMPNVILTPHCAGCSERNEADCAATFLDNYERYCYGKPLQHLVDKQAGY